MHHVDLLFRVMDSPKDSQWQVGKIIMRYIARTTGYGILHFSTSSD
jgi:hypothetical protein